MKTVTSLSKARNRFAAAAGKPASDPGQAGHRLSFGRARVAGRPAPATWAAPAGRQRM